MLRALEIKMDKDIVVGSGGFDPLHSGHISYIKAAKEHGDYLIVALNSDNWLKEKKGKAFMDFQERKNILENLSVVDEVIAFEDDIKGSCRNALYLIKENYSNSKITFCNGGDRGKDNIPEMDVDGVHFEFGVGGDNKQNSSSWILKNWKYESEERVWGKFFNLFETDGIKVKELIIFPGKGMSLQRHFKRSEIWFVSEGKCVVNYSKNLPEEVSEILLNKDQTLKVELGDWHQITNPFEQECRIIEIQYGEETDENDIERHSLYKNNEK